MEKKSKEVARSSGKWKVAGVPHKGWTCIGTEDLGEPSTTCQMCETTEIRYVHYMEHPKYPVVLDCGCVCAGHMEEDYEGAQARETVLLNAAKRRQYWPKRKWRTSPKGNAVIRVKEFLVTVFKKDTYWSASVKDQATDQLHFAKRKYTSEEAAKLATFDVITFLANRKSS